MNDRDTHPRDDEDTAGTCLAISILLLAGACGAMSSQLAPHLIGLLPAGRLITSTIGPGTLTAILWLLAASPFAIACKTIPWLHEHRRRHRRRRH